MVYFDISCAFICIRFLSGIRIEICLNGLKNYETKCCDLILGADEKNKYSDEYLEKELLPFLNTKSEDIEDKAYNDICAHILLRSCKRDSKNKYIESILKYCPKAFWVNRLLCLGVSMFYGALENFKILIHHFSMFNSPNKDVMEEIMNVYCNCIKIACSLTCSTIHNSENSLYGLKFVDYILKSISINKTFLKDPKKVQIIFEKSLQKCIELIPINDYFLNISVLKKVLNLQLKFPNPSIICNMCYYANDFKENRNEMLNILRSYFECKPELFTWECLLNALRTNHFELIKFLFKNYQTISKESAIELLLECIPFQRCTLKNGRTLNQFYKIIQVKIDCISLILKKSNMKYISQKDEYILMNKFNKSLDIFGYYWLRPYLKEKKSIRNYKIYSPVFKIHKEIFRIGKQHQERFGQKVLPNSFKEFKLSQISDKYICRQTKKYIRRNKCRMIKSIDIWEKSLKSYFLYNYKIPIEVSSLIFMYVNGVNGT